MTLFRYPGGKSKLLKEIISRLLEGTSAAPCQYREPFFGGGSVGLAMLHQPQVRSVWINDKDPGIAALWTAIARHPNRLIERIKGFFPCVDAFDAFKAELRKVAALPNDAEAVVDIGFKKLALHQMSFSGLGMKSGGRSEAGRNYRTQK